MSAAGRATHWQSVAWLCSHLSGVIADFHEASHQLHRCLRLHRLTLIFGALVLFIVLLLRGRGMRRRRLNTP